MTKEVLISLLLMIAAISCQVVGNDCGLGIDAETMQRIVQREQRPRLSTYAVVRAANESTATRNLSHAIVLTEHKTGSWSLFHLIRGQIGTIAWHLAEVPHVESRADFVSKPLDGDIDLFYQRTAVMIAPHGHLLEIDCRVVRK